MGDRQTERQTETETHTQYSRLDLATFPLHPQAHMAPADRERRARVPKEERQFWSDKNDFCRCVEVEVSVLLALSLSFSLSLPSLPLSLPPSLSRRACAGAWR